MSCKEKKLCPPNNILYKYTTAERGLAILNSGKIFFPKAFRFNEPFDCTLPFTDEITQEDFITGAFRITKKDKEKIKNYTDKIEQSFTDNFEFNEDIKKNNKKIYQEFIESNENSGILSLSEDPMNPLMWAHYAESHKGICIGFKLEGFEDKDKILKVQYSNEIPDIRLGEILYFDGRLSTKLFATKAIDWAYEKEWRILTKKGDNYEDIPGKICEIILGYRIDDTTKKNVSKICNEKNIKYYFCDKVEDKFEFYKSVIKVEKND
ncbi:DUF2971 domain-containing protein [Candidatus Dependentiae bacterium]|nr:DUF2971 domain-containing protein [Candidatus Dependentiae bacterium]